MSEMISDRERPYVALPLASKIVIVEADMLANGSGYQSAGHPVADTLVDLCQQLRGTLATHVQVFDRLPDGRRVPACFCDIADTAAWVDPSPSGPDAPQSGVTNGKTEENQQRLF